ncbi:ABC transporter ATP-binding protein [Streptococcus sp. SS6]|nr:MULTISPECIES: ABC transporter ATP-binding protein [Streptococcus]MBK5156810.1 ABC transporter ATP-binding protein [Streptococcus sp. 23.2]ARI60584.1 multidrug ABC transporter ATP-binding protein [Streptococcus salivarius]MBS7055250.1 ABC transporter ATP-binding protein [Streptococcus salivarius]MBT0940229.1 ABC transporter ATP-binding protein [Streptococcus salivarius]MBT2137083.1 ABC transporter ATP-binding protein [Streptococcus salivarius]
MIEVKGLGKKYKGNAFYSLENATFTIEEGDIIGLVGKNGSGKSTLLKILAKSQNPTEGNVFFNGRDIFKEDNILKDFGIMIEPVFFPQISVEENLKLYLKIHKKEQYQDNIEKILKLVGLWEAKDRKPIDFSFGMKQRTALALALVTEPQFVLLDEPFVGLDPIGVKNLLEILKQWSKVNKTSMIISSHQLAELEDLCTRYLFIESGIIDDKISTEQNSIIIELNEIFRDEDNHLIENLVKKYSLKYSENNIEIDNSVNNEALNSILEQLAVAKLINNVLSKKDSLERLFVEE